MVWSLYRWWLNVVSKTPNNFQSFIPAITQIEGVDKNSSLGRAILDRYSAALNQFYVSQRQHVNLSVIPTHRGQLNVAGMSAQYTMLHGQEIMKVRARPEVIAELKAPFKYTPPPEAIKYMISSAVIVGGWPQSRKSQTYYYPVDAYSVGGRPLNVGFDGQFHGRTFNATDFVGTGFDDFLLLDAYGRGADIPATSSPRGKVVKPSTIPITLSGPETEWDLLLESGPPFGGVVNGNFVQDKYPPIPLLPSLPRPYNWPGRWNPGPNYNLQQFRTGPFLGGSYNIIRSVWIQMVDFAPPSASYDMIGLTTRTTPFLAENQVISFKPVAFRRSLVNPANFAYIDALVLFQRTTPVNHSNTGTGLAPSSLVQAGPAPQASGSPAPASGQGPAPSSSQGPAPKVGG